MKLPDLGKSSDLGSGPDLGLAKKGESILSRPMHQIARRATPKVMGGTLHGAHIKMKGMGKMPGIPAIKGIPNV